MFTFDFLRLSSSCSGSAAGVSGGPEEAVHEGGAPGEAEKRYGAGQDLPPHRQGLRTHDRGGPRRQERGHQCGEQTVSSVNESINDLPRPSSGLKKGLIPFDLDEIFMIIETLVAFQVITCF